jgi:hypothetical protein
MLIDKKFIFINLPRCASTSFHISCINSEFNVEYFTNRKTLNKVKKFNETDIVHVHEPVNRLIKKFGDKYPIISVKRDKYERFLSMWKHVISEAEKCGEKNTVNLFTKLKISDILYYKSDDLITAKNRHEFIIGFLNRVGINHEMVDLRVLTMLNVLIKPTSDYHQNNPKIIWFDFNNLDQMEAWVRNITNKEFELLNLNSSRFIETEIIIDEEFKKLYNNIYEVFEVKKELKTLI